jgi:hypothetical protein
VQYDVAFKDEYFEFSVRPELPTYSVNDFMHQLDQHVNLFNQKMTQFGIHRHFFGDIARDQDRGDEKSDDEHQIIDPHPGTTQNDIKTFLKMKLTADSSLQIVTTNTFLNCFVIEFTDYGMQLLGINKATLHKVGERYYYAVQQDEKSMPNEVKQFVATDLVLDPTVPYTYVIPQNTVRKTLYNTTPLYECCDQRVYVSVSTHLPMDSHVMVQNEAQQSVRDIAIAFFENQLETTLSYDNMNNMTHTLKGTSYSGQTHMIRKTDSNIKWIKLKDSYDLHNLRFYLHVCYKLFSTTAGFSLQKHDFPIGKDDYWQLFVRFVSEY